MTVKGFCLRSVAVVAALWVTEAATLLLPRGDHLLWQLDSWLYWLAVVATVAMTLGVTILVCRRRHWLLQVTCWVVWLVNLLGLMAVMLVLAVCVDRLPGQCCWEQDGYLIRCDDVDCNQVLYERRGMVEHRLYVVWFAWPDAPDNYSICTCREHDMLLLECYDYYKNRDYRLLHLDGTAYEGDIDTLLCSHLAKKNLASL